MGVSTGMLAGESARVAQTSGGVGGAYVTTKSVVTYAPLARL